mgnify:CR=1 FL=1
MRGEGARQRLPDLREPEAGGPGATCKLEEAYPADYVARVMALPPAQRDRFLRNFYKHPSVTFPTLAQLFSGLEPWVENTLKREKREKDMALCAAVAAVLPSDQRGYLDARARRSGPGGSVGSDATLQAAYHGGRRGRQADLGVLRDAAVEHGGVGPRPVADGSTGQYSRRWPDWSPLFATVVDSPTCCTSTGGCCATGWKLGDVTRPALGHAMTFTCRWCGRPAPELAAILAHQRDDAACAARTQRHAVPSAGRHPRARVLIALGQAMRQAPR